MPLGLNFKSCAQILGRVVYSFRLIYTEMMNRKKRRTDLKQSKPAREEATRELFASALQHHQSGRLHEAGQLYRQVLAINPSHPDSLHLLGVVAHRTGRCEPAIRLINKAIAINNQVGPYHFNLALALEEAERLDEAVTCYRRAIALWPDNPDAYSNLGSILGIQGRLDEAVMCFRKAIELEPDFAEAHTNLGNALKDQGQLDEAVACCRRAIELAPNMPEAHSNLGGVLEVCGRLHEAVACYRRAIELAPNMPEGHFHLSMALLAQGDMSAGWEEYEWRWKTRLMIRERRNFAQPQWRGEPAEGRTLLIHAEQGFGDTLQFCRYAPLAAARGLRVIMEVPKPLVRLLRGLPGVDQVVGHGDALPRFDLQSPMVSLPRAIGTTIETIPGAVPYLYADDSEVAYWRRRLAFMSTERPRIGLVWAGSPANHSPAMAARRSIAPELLAPLFEFHGLQFFSLQKYGPAAPGNFPLIDFMEEMEDFADTAAMVANLDLIISVDTAVAHLAAAIGKPVWLMNRFDSCWRWLSGRRDSPWYPTLRIYEQPKPGDWDFVVNKIAGDLSSLCKIT